MLNEPRKEMGEAGAELGIEGQSKSPVFLQEDYDLANTNVVRSEGYATMFIDPDVIEFFLRADSIKDSAEEVKTSISKRIDYLLQVVKSKIQGEKNISVHELLDKRDDMYTMSAEILVKCGSLQKYEEIRNIVVEKLGGTVFVSEPRHYHTHRCLQDARRLYFESVLRSNPLLFHLTLEDKILELYYNKKTELISTLCLLPLHSEALLQLPLFTLQREKNKYTHRDDGMHNKMDSSGLRTMEGRDVFPSVLVASSSSHEA
ncbi:uncharacterized protein LOC126284849 isoform X2 [Schistocerca gregaria]|uniref:uncharacterized protein LOC126284849 isoform X2 n=1 Tax=Schistocerca gregaria TaxID=7010 RepID=UPI00211E8442|nr:uncharacterized protein LOC126284849 isoform X2 [Schistocerca gregaria]